MSERDGQEYIIPTGPFDYVDPMTFNKGPLANDKESNEILVELGLPPLASRKRKKKTKKKGEEGESDDEDGDSDSDEEESDDVPVAKKARRKFKPPVSAKSRKKVAVPTEAPLKDISSDIIIVSILVILIITLIKVSLILIQPKVKIEGDEESTTANVTEKIKSRARDEKSIPSARVLVRTISLFHDVVCILKLEGAVGIF